MKIIYRGLFNEIWEAKRLAEIGKGPQIVRIEMSAKEFKTMAMERAMPTLPFPSSILGIPLVIKS